MDKRRYFYFLFVVVLLINLVNTEQVVNQNQQILIERTSSSETFKNINGGYTSVLSSNIKNVYEDNQWKKVENAKSLKDKGFNIIYLEDDGIHKIEVIDFNYTSIQFNFSYDKNNLGEFESEVEFGKMKTKFKIIETFFNETTGKFYDVEIEQEIEIEEGNQANIIYYGNPLGKKFKLGESSTSIEITSSLGTNQKPIMKNRTTAEYCIPNLNQRAGGWSGQSSYPCSLSPNYDTNIRLPLYFGLGGITASVFNVTEINSSFVFSGGKETGTANIKDLRQVRILEGTVAQYNDCGDGTTYGDIDLSDTNIIQNVTLNAQSRTDFKTDIDNGESTFGICYYVPTLEAIPFTGGIDETILFSTSPQEIVITYTPYVSVLFPSEGESFNESDVPKFNLTTATDMNNCDYELNSVSNHTMNKENSTSFNITNSSIPNGSHSVRYWCNETSSGDFKKSISINFEMLSLVPNVTVDSPIGVQTNTTFLVNWTATDNFDIFFCQYNITFNDGASTLVSNTNLSKFDDTNQYNTTNTGNDGVTYELNVRCDDFSSNINYTNQSFSISVPVDGGGGGGGGGDVNFVFVVALIKPDIDITYQDITRAKLYAGINSFCLNNSVGDVCIKTDEKVSELSSQLKNKYLLSLTNDVLLLWIFQYENDRIENIKIEQTTAERLGLVIASVITLEQQFTLNPSRVDAPKFLIAGNKITQLVQSSEVLKSCEVLVDSSDWDCEITETSATITYTVPEGSDFTFKTVKTTIGYTSIDDKNAFQTIQFRIIRVTPILLASLIIFIVVGVLGFINRKKLFKLIRKRTKFFRK